MSDEATRARFLALAGALHQTGVTDALLELAPLLDGVADPELQGEMAQLLGFCHLRHNRLAQAVPYCRLACDRLPQRPEVAYNLAYALCQLRQPDEAIAVIEAALARLGERDLLLALLTNVCAVSGREDRVREFGTRTLAAKDALTAGQPGRDLSACPVPPFDARRRERHIISFSLYGALPRYTDSALWNAEAARYVYPGWTCRFYVDDSVPEAVVQGLMARGAQIAKPQGLPAQPWGTLWRFLVADDADVDRYLVRDADSLLNVREAAAVQEWLASGRHFHVMRDHFDHSDLVLAGMWGGVRGALPSVLAQAQQYLGNTSRVRDRTADQGFLCERMWPTMRRSVMAHDSQFGFGAVRDFPAWAQLPPGCWVGGDARTLLACGRPAG